MSNTSSVTKKRLTLFINPLIIKHARAQAILDETTLTKLVEKALIKYLPKETIIKNMELDSNITPEK